MDLYDLLQNHAAVFLLVLCRISGIFIISPFFGSANIPSYIRVGAAVAMSFVMFPVVDATVSQAAPATIMGYALAVLSELFVGWLIGFVAFIAFSAIHMAGKLMDMQVGFSVVNVMDPTSGQQIPLIGSFLYNLGVIVLLVTNGHHVIITALAESFASVPVMGMNVSMGLPMLIANFTTGIFVAGLQLAMPVTFSILLTNVALGILARTMPQINIFVVGIPMHIMIGLFTLGILLPFYVLFLDGMFDGMYSNISAALQALQ